MESVDGVGLWTDGGGGCGVWPAGVSGVTVFCLEVVGISWLGGVADSSGGTGGVA